MPVLSKQDLERMVVDTLKELHAPKWKLRLYKHRYCIEREMPSWSPYWTDDGWDTKRREADEEYERMACKEAEDGVVKLEQSPDFGLSPEQAFSPFKKTVYSIRPLVWTRDTRGRYIAKNIVKNIEVWNSATIVGREQWLWSQFLPHGVFDTAEDAMRAAESYWREWLSRSTLEKIEVAPSMEAESSCPSPSVTSATYSATTDESLSSG